MEAILKDKKAKVVTLGCQLNENDSEKIMGMLVAMGAEPTERYEDANVIIFNTCAVRENAEKKILGLLGSIKKLAENDPSLLIGICGCMASEAHMAELVAKKYRHVRLIFGTCAIGRFPTLLLEALHKEKGTVIDIAPSKSIAENLPTHRKTGPKAWLPVMYGCDNFCSYCIVPWVRGRERSRLPEDIFKEAKAIAKDGYKEIMLLGQNVNSYGKGLEGEPDFASLLYRLDTIEGLERIRFMTSHPKDMHPRLIRAMADCRHVCKQLHLPIQSGSSRVLKEMNRHYTREDYLKLIHAVREAMPDIVLSTDIMVGFPGETEADFAETLSLLEEVRFDSAFTFIYSRRVGTPAAEREDQIPEEIMHERFDRLVALQNAITLEKNMALKDRVLEVLVEGKSESSALLTGRTVGNRLVHFEGAPSLIGTLTPVKITKPESFCLYGELVH